MGVLVQCAESVRKLPHIAMQKEGFFMETVRKADS
jgi:hypothetical protein